jgi:hypothetical protein
LLKSNHRPHEASAQKGVDVRAIEQSVATLVSISTIITEARDTSF